MTSRMIVLVVASLCVVLAPVRPSSAQSGVPIRASYQGHFLPEGTEIVVLFKEGRVQRDGRFQPEFFPTHDFPRESRKTLRRERLGDAGLSSRTYEGTQDSGRLYFIYALAPDSTLYWSYSAKRDSLKYDVVRSGVMSVAPVPASDIREDILRSFFRSRVTVVMRGEEPQGRRNDPTDVAMRGLEETGDAGDSRSDAGPLELEVDSASLTTAAASPPSDVRAAAQDTALAQADVLPIAIASPPDRTASTGVTLSPLLVWIVLILFIAGIGVPAYFARTFRTELKRVRREMLALRDRTASVNELPNPRGIAQIDEYAELRAVLEDADLRYRQLEEDYDILQARYEALAREVAA